MKLDRSTALQLETTQAFGFGVIAISQAIRHFAEEYGIATEEPMTFNEVALRDCKDDTTEMLRSLVLCCHFLDTFVGHRNPSASPNITRNLRRYFFPKLPDEIPNPNKEKTH